jgi:hypothetical protein
MENGLMIGAAHSHVHADVECIAIGAQVLADIHVLPYTAVCSAI